MEAGVDGDGALAAKLQVIFPHLDERQRRLLAGAEARALGCGGIRALARAAGMGEGTLARGGNELDSGVDPTPGRARAVGGGRKRWTELDPGLRAALLVLIEPDERGDPMSPLRWRARLSRALAAQLTGPGQRGHRG